jgi:hypothetical protein
MLRWMVDSLFDTAAYTVKTSTSSLQNETRLLTDRACELVTRPSPEKRQRALKEYQKNVEPIKQRHEERKAAHEARYAQENSTQSQDLAAWKRAIDVLLTEINRDISAINQAYAPLLWRWQLNTLCQEKDALLTISAARTSAELKLFAEQQQKKLQFDTTKKVGNLLNQIIRSKEKVNMATLGCKI